MNHINRFIRKCSIGEYSVIYRKIEDDNIKHTIFGGKKEYKMLSPNMRYWYADPIAYVINKKTYVFMEMMDAYLKKGVIGVSYFKNDGRLSKPKVIIDEPFHMSFPHVFSFEGKIYMIPETSEVNEFRIYKMGASPYQWEIFIDAKTEYKFVDTITYERNGNLFLITCELSKNPLYTKLHLFKILNFQQFELEEIRLEDSEFRLDCRNAGRLLY